MAYRAQTAPAPASATVTAPLFPTQVVPVNATTTTTTTFAAPAPAPATVTAPLVPRARTADASSAHVRQQHDAQNEHSAQPVQLIATNLVYPVSEHTRAAYVCPPLEPKRTLRPPFYNTKEGQPRIEQLRAQHLGAKVGATAAASSSSFKSRYSTINAHESYVPCDLVLRDVTLRPRFAPYPPNELLPKLGASVTHPRYLYHPPPQPAPIHERHHLYPNVLKHSSTSNFNHGRQFVAKHTNNLVDS